MNPKVSVITVCYNADDFIEHAIKSVLEQTYKDIEYLIIDGNSDDNTVSIINKYKDKIDYFISEPDNGIYDAMNKGINAASGEILYFLNADDVFYDKYVVENVVKVFQQNKNIELIYGTIIRKNSITNETLVKTHKKISKSSFISGSICQQGIFFRADNFEKYGLFDDTYRIVGDYEWELRTFYKYNIKRKYYPGVLAIFSDGGISGSDNSPQLYEERRKVIKIYFTKLDIYKFRFVSLIKKILRKIISLTPLFRDYI